MAKHVEFEGTVHEFPDDFTDTDIGKALASAPSGKVPGLEKLGGKPPAVSAPLPTELQADRAPNAWAHPTEGLIGQGVSQIGRGIARLAQPGKQAKYSAGSEILAGTGRMLAPAAIGATLPALITAPVATAAGIGAGAAAGYAGSELAKAGARAFHATPEGEQLAGDLAAIPSGMVGGYAASKVAGSLAPRLYQGSLKPPVTLTKGDPARLNRMINTGLEEGIPVTGSGADRTQAAIENLHNQASGTIAQGAAAGKTVDPLAVADYTNRSRNGFANQVNPVADLDAIAKARQEFLESKGGMAPQASGLPPLPPRPIPVDEAHALKSGTYQALKKNYGQMSGAANEAQKDLAYGLKTEIYKQFPELAALGEKEGALIDLDRALERYVQRHGNRDAIGIGTPIAAAGVHALGASTPATIAATVVKAALTYPPVSSRIAIALQRASRISPMPNAIGGALGPAVGSQLPALITPQNLSQQ